MSDLAINPAFLVYALFAVGLCVLLMAIDSAGGVVRVRTKTVVNREDTSTVAKGAALVDADPDGVARVMRAHRNAVANIVPFLVVTLVWVLLGATPEHVLWICTAYSAARIIHAIAYIRAVQPFRTLSFVVGQLCTFAVAARVVLAAVHMLGLTGLAPRVYGASSTPPAEVCAEAEVAASTASSAVPSV